MKKLYTLTLLSLICAFHASGQYVTIWKTDNPGISGNRQIFIPASGENYNITWEEVGNPTNNGSEIGSGFHLLTFPSVGTYRVSITPGSGTFTRISFNISTDSRKLLQVEQWGDIQWESMENAYAYCINLTITATDIPDLTNVTSMFGMFTNCQALSNVPGINNWDVSNVTEMEGMFAFAIQFNQPLADWEVGNVTNMDGMFMYTAFNQPINSWNLSSLTTMQSMFYASKSFNQPLSNWDVSNVTDMSNMFLGASSFNQPLGSWPISASYSMDNMFRQSGMDCASLALTLQGWAANPATPSNVTLGAQELLYALEATAALETLRTTKNWTITIGDAVVCGALEVALISFDARSTDGTVKLDWATASETNNDYFEVERSADTRSWNVIGLKEGAGNVNSIRRYSLIDQNPLDGISYYRLKIVDRAGKADYSLIRAVKTETSSALSVYPNPASEILLIENYQQVEQVEIFNAAGNKLLENKKVTAQGIDIRKISAGLHTVKLHYSDGHFQTTKLVIFR